MALQRGRHPRYQIKALSSQLRKLTLPTSPISIALATFAADAFDKFLTGEYATLDEAFGVAKRSGAPRRLSKAKEHLRFAEEISDLRGKGKTWYQLEGELGMDAGALRRSYAPFKIALLSRRIGKKLHLRKKSTRK